MRVAMVGPPLSGKSTLFAAVAEAGGSHVHLERADQEHLAVVKVPDQRLDWLHEHYHTGKCHHAELEFLDVPGLDLTTEPARHHARTHWPAVRQSDMIVLVLRSFHDPSVPAYRDRVDVGADLEELGTEMLFSDLEQVTARIDKVQAALRKSSRDREAHERELELMQRLRETLEAEKPLSEAVANAEEEKLVRAFAFLTLKPAIAVVNCDEDAVPAQPPEKLGDHPALHLSAKIEEEIAALPEQERGEFLEAMGISAPARERLIRSCYSAMNLVSFFTHNENECRAWSVPAGTDAVTAAGEIHSDIARGFIRAEVVAFEDLRAAGEAKAARAAGKFRLEGKSYLVQDGDVILFRFNV